MVQAAPPRTAAVQAALTAGDTDTALHLLNRDPEDPQDARRPGRRPRDDDPAPVPLVPRPTRLGVRLPVGRVPPGRGHARLARPRGDRGPAGRVRGAGRGRGRPGRPVGLGCLPGLPAARGHDLPPEPAVPDARVQAVLIAVYRGDPDAALVAERLVDLDEGVQEWRYRHVKMVERTIGTKRGTGGSSGVEYLRATLFRPVFPDLWEIRSSL